MSKLNTSLQSILSQLNKLKETKRGHQWTSLCPIHKEKTPSFTVTLNPDKLLFHCQGCGAGSKEISEWSGIPEKDFFASTKDDVVNIPKQKKKHVFSTANEAVKFLRERMGKEDYLWVYNVDTNPHSIVLRWNNINEKKQFRPISRQGEGWIIGAAPSKRPLYCIDAVKETDEVVYVVEGEKCADKMRALQFNCTTSQGGSKAAKLTDWTSLKGRDVVLIEDKGVSGQDYGKTVREQLKGIANTFVSIELPDLQNDGEDIFEWFNMYGGTKEKLLTLIAEAKEPGFQWSEELELTKHGKVQKISKNIDLILKHDPIAKGRLSYNELSDKMCLDGKTAQEHELKIMRREIAHKYLIDFPDSTFFDAVEMECRDNSFNPLSEYLKGLKWDGKERVNSWLRDYLESEQPQEYLSIVGRKWLVGAVARAMQPGCKMDNLLVLEGEQGIGKSTVFSILGGAFYSDSLQGVTNKDDFMLMAGKWILEVPEMGAVLRSGPAEVKAFFSRSSDEYRKPYARMMTSKARTCVFGGTTNDDDYLRDETGSRRFWPVKCEGIELDKLREDVGQLWAEAFHMYQAGEAWHVNQQEARICAQQQSSRQQEDVYSTVIMQYVAMNNYKPFRLLDLMTSMDGLQMDLDKIDRRSQNRVIKTLKTMGAERKRTNKEKLWLISDPETESATKKKSEGHSETVGISGLRPCDPKTDSTSTFEVKIETVKEKVEAKVGTHGHQSSETFINQGIEEVTPKQKVESPIHKHNVPPVESVARELTVENEWSDYNEDRETLFDLGKQREKNSSNKGPDYTKF